MLPLWHLVYFFKSGGHFGKMAVDSSSCVFRTQHVLFSLNTKFHQNRTIFARFTAFSLPSASIKLKWGGQKAPFGAQTPNTWGFLVIFSLELVSTHQILSFDMSIV